MGCPQDVMPDKSQPRTKRAKDGDFVQIPIDEARWNYGRVAGRTVAVYDIIASDEMPIEEINTHAVLFRVCVVKHAFNGRAWPVIGHLPLGEDLQRPQEFLSTRTDRDKEKYCATIDGSEYHPSTYDHATELEINSVYDPEHVQERLALYAEGKPDPQVEMFRVR